MNQDRSTQIFFGIVFVGIPALYGIWRLIPYLLFYLLPFVFFTALFVAIWFGVLSVSEENYSWLGLVIPATAVALYVLLGFPKESSFSKNGIPVEGKFLFEWFNQTKTWFDVALWSLIPEGLFFIAPQVPVPWVPYDLNTLRWIFWVSYGVTSPLLFFAVGTAKAYQLKKDLEAKYTKIAEENLRHLRARQSENSSLAHHAKEQQKNFEREKNDLLDEIAKLKELIKFKRKADGPSILDTPPSGVLDSDEL